MSESAPTTSSTSSDRLRDPDELADEVLKARESADWEANQLGDISAEGVRRLVRVAFFASLSPNEGRYPALTLVVPAQTAKPELLIGLEGELSVGLLQRLGPAIHDERQVLVVREQGKGLRVEGIAATVWHQMELGLVDPATAPHPRPAGLFVEISKPGHLRVSEHRAHTLHAGALRQEKSFTFDKWFSSWYESAGAELLVQAGDEVTPPGSAVDPGFLLMVVWLRLLRQAARLRHGACVAIIPDSPEKCLRPVFQASACDLGKAIVSFRESLAAPFPRPFMVTNEAVRARALERQRLSSAIEAVAHLTATDGCVVLNRHLRLVSFGSMIEVTQSEVPVYLGDTIDQLSDTQLQQFGARRKSAMALCRASPGSLVFVISQDGDLRAFAHRDGAVRLYDNLAYW